MRGKNLGKYTRTRRICNRSCYRRDQKVISLWNQYMYIRCHGLIPDCIVMALIRIFYLKVLLTCPRLFHQFRYVIYHSYFLLELSTTTQILVKKHFAKIILLFFAITNQTYTYIFTKQAISVVAYSLSHYSDLALLLILCNKQKFFLNILS